MEGCERVAAVLSGRTVGRVSVESLLGLITGGYTVQEPRAPGWGGAQVVVALSVVTCSGRDGAGVRAFVRPLNGKEAWWRAAAGREAIYGGAVFLDEGSESSGVALLRRCLWLLLVELLRSGMDAEGGPLTCTPGRANTTWHALGVAALCCVGGALAVGVRLGFNLVPVP